MGMLAFTIDILHHLYLAQINYTSVRKMGISHPLRFIYILDAASIMMMYFNAIDFRF